MNNQDLSENLGTSRPTNSPAIPLGADRTVHREAPGGVAESDWKNFQWGIGFTEF